MRSYCSKALLTLALLPALGAAACNKPQSNPSGSAGSAPSPTAAAAPSAVPSGPPSAEAQKIFTERCSICHGTSGKGDGVGAAALNPKPRNYGDKAWQASVTDEQIKKTIVYGGAAVGKSPIMPSSPDLDGKTETVDGLVKIIRAFGK